MIRKPRTLLGGLAELAVIAALAIGVALGLQALIVKPYKIPSPSMEPTLDVGQRVLVDRLSYRLGADPEIGDVVVFHPPLGATPSEQDPADPLPQCAVGQPERGPDQVCPTPSPTPADATFIKRVVAGPGDSLRVADGIPIVNGTEVAGDWRIEPCDGLAGCDFPTGITIPPGHWFMMGDNRGRSQDSRFWGPVPREWIIGGAVVTYWPPNRIGAL